MEILWTVGGFCRSSLLQAGSDRGIENGRGIASLTRTCGATYLPSLDGYLLSIYPTARACSSYAFSCPVESNIRPGRRPPGKPRGPQPSQVPFS